MAVREATPSTVGAVVSSSVRGDEIVLLGGIYGALPGKAGVSFRAFDYEPDRVIRDVVGHFGQGMGVHVRGVDATPEDDIDYKGIFFDARMSSSINAYLINGDNAHFYGCAMTDRHVTARKIGFTVGQGTDRVRGFKFEKGRYHYSGKIGDTHDHPFYLKNTEGWAVTESLIYDAGHFALHLYPNADNGLAEHNVIWGCGLGITFSGAADSSTGVYSYETSNGNVVQKNIIGNGRMRGALIETWTSGAPVSGNIVRENLITRGGGIAIIREADLPGILYENNIDKDPGFRDPANGDFRRTGTYDGYGPAALFATVTPPPPDPDPDPEPPSDDCADVRAELVAMTTARNTALFERDQAIEERNTAAAMALDLRGRIDRAKVELG